MLVALLIPWQCATAGNLCPPPPKEKHTSEEGIGGAIPEEAFTESEAQHELDRLKHFLPMLAEPADDYIWDNSFTIIKGWLLKKRAMLPAKERPPRAVEDFCTFLKGAHLGD